MNIPFYYAALLVVAWLSRIASACAFAFVATPLLLSTTGISRGSGMPPPPQQQKQQRLHHLFGYLDDIASDNTSSSSSSSQHELLTEEDPAHLERFDEYMAKAEAAFARAQSRMEHMRVKEAKSQKSIVDVQERMK
jgi:hypothetical protein